jgi:hypothetical protein
MATRPDYWSIAQAAMQFTLNALPLGATDRSDDVLSVKVPVLAAAMIFQRAYQGMAAGLDSIGRSNLTFLDSIQRASFYAQKYGCGNCWEHASVTYLYLRERGTRPIAFLGLSNHALVLLGNDHKTDLTDPSSYPDWSVVCDSWQKVVFPGPRFKQYEKKSDPLPMWVDMD